MYHALDVVGLYPHMHIPHEEGLMNMKKIMEDYRREYKESGKQEVSIDDVVDLARFILENKIWKILSLMVAFINRSWVLL